MEEERDRAIADELPTIQSKLGSRADEGIRVIACVPITVQVAIRVSDQRQLTVHFQFPAGYPQTPILVELKSKTLPYKLLDGLVKLCDDEAKKYVGQRQAIVMVDFIKTFMEENPLCICNDEISYIKKYLLEEIDDMKLKQKNSQIILKVCQDRYFLRVKMTIPELYPIHPVKLELVDHNFPELLKTNFIAMSNEIARQCVQAPMRKKAGDPPFEPKPSLQPVCDYLIKNCVKLYPREQCPLCKRKALREDPQEKLPHPGLTVERVYCGHIFHHGCVDKYMKAPPFTGGKRCPSCDKQIFHEKWKTSPQLMETRWAHHQARQRELAEVTDFLK